MIKWVFIMLRKYLPCFAPNRNSYGSLQYPCCWNTSQYRPCYFNAYTCKNRLRNKTITRKRLNVSLFPVIHIVDVTNVLEETISRRWFFRSLSRLLPFLLYSLLAVMSEFLFAFLFNLTFSHTFDTSSSFPLFLNTVLPPVLGALWVFPFSPLISCLLIILTVFNFTYLSSPLLQTSRAHWAQVNL